ncbi:MAG: type II toxin-antitoxin system RelE/ParE family toxin [Gammaproteobacteria bacterium]
MFYEIRTTDVFDKWASDIKNPEAARAIALRLARVRAGNLGDVISVGEGISEMRIFVGKGYRLYFTIRGGDLVILLCGGDKSSQQRDINKAKELAKNL